MDYFAHTEDKAGKKELVLDHLLEVAKLTADFASIWGAQEEGFATGLLHDLGKYSELFQSVLKGEAMHVDHATPGALVALKLYRNQGLASAIAIEGHHEGLKEAAPTEVSRRVKMINDISETGKRYSEKNAEILINKLMLDGVNIPDTFLSLPSEMYQNNISSMLYIRMLFSALTDADFLATEAHFKKTSTEYAYRRYNHTLNKKSIEKAIEKLMGYLDGLRSIAKSGSDIQLLRDDLFNSCTKNGNNPQGIYTLSAPTGAGKTLAMLAFALTHAKKHNLSRIIFVLPFLNIIEQVARVYKNVIGHSDPELTILEDHSLTETQEDSALKYLAENWDAPIIITTTIKLFESLFANKSTSCRRLHNIANSIILFDEAQTMPVGLAAPTLVALKELNKNYGCTIVFSTATQPAFDALDEQIKKYTQDRWETRELVPKELNLFERAKRVDVKWHREPISWSELIQQIKKEPQVLTVVNLRKHAQDIYKLMLDAELEGIFHLSTNMCPKHRLYVLDEVKKCLENERFCRLVATQCIEAGVDLDFPVVYRAFAPLEAIVQAAGRCNRNGKKRKGLVHVIKPTNDNERYPTKDYELATVEVQKLLIEKGNIDISSPEMLKEYYENYFSIISMGERSKKLYHAIKAYEFPEVARLYRWIPNAGMNILVPYKPYIDDFDYLTEKARNGEIDFNWLQKARLLSVNIIPKKDSDLTNYLEPIRDRKGIDTGWYILLNSQVYTEKTGLDMEFSNLDDYCLV